LNALQLTVLSAVPLKSSLKTSRHVLRSGVGTGMSTIRRSSSLNVTGAVVDATDVRSAVAPAVCGPLVILISVRHAAGSAVPAFHALARRVVGLAPWSCTRSM